MNTNHDLLRQADIVESKIRKESKTVDYHTVDYPLDYFLNSISPEQINDELHWDTTRQSHFIESLILGLPVLNIVIEEINIEKGKFEENLRIIDGKQRLYTTLNFVNGQLRLENLEILTALEGFRFEDLVPSRQTKIKKMFVRTIVLAPNSNSAYWRKATLVV